MPDNPDDDDATVIQHPDEPSGGDPEATPAPAADAKSGPGEPKPAEVGDAMAEIQKRGQLKGKEDIKGRIRVLSRKDLEEIIAGLLRKYGSLSNQDLIAQLGALEMQAAQDKAKHERDMQALRDEFNQALDAQRLQFEQEKEAALAELKARIIELEKELEQQKIRPAELEAKLLQAMSEIERLSKELAAANAALNTNDKRSKAELLKLIAELQARIAELEMALDYFDLEEEFDYDAFVKYMEELSAKLQGAAGDKAVLVYGRAKEIQSSGMSNHEKFNALAAKMYEAKGSIGVIVDLAKLIKECEGAARRGHDVDATYEAIRS